MRCRHVCQYILLPYICQQTWTRAINIESLLRGTLCFTRDHPHHPHPHLSNSTHNVVNNQQNTYCSHQSTEHELEKVVNSKFNKTSVLVQTVKTEEVRNLKFYRKINIFTFNIRFNSRISLCAGTWERERKIKPSNNRKHVFLCQQWEKGDHAVSVYHCVWPLVGLVRSRDPGHRQFLYQKAATTDNQISRNWAPPPQHRGKGRDFVSLLRRGSGRGCPPPDFRGYWTRCIVRQVHGGDKSWSESLERL